MTGFPASATAGDDRPAPAPPRIPAGLAELLSLPLPPNVADQGDEPVAALGVGAAGKVGWADLALIAINGQTRLTRAEARVPYQVGRPHQRADLGDLAYLYLTMPTGGLVQGDRVAVRVVTAAGVRARLTTPAATKIYGMTANYASQGIHLTAQAGAWLEWWPEPTIPYRHARYLQATTLAVAPGGVLLWGEVVHPGRLAHGERHAYGWLALNLTVRDEADQVIVADRQCYQPARRPIDAPGRLRAWPVLTGAYLLAPGRDLAPLYDALVALLERRDGVLAAVSTLPGQFGLVMRALAATGDAASALLAEVNALAGHHLARPAG